MKRIFSFFVASVLLSISAVAQVLSPGLTTHWKKTQAESGYLVTGQFQRAMAIYNGDLLIPNRNGHISVISTADGSLKKTITVTGVTGWLLSGITVTTDNVILLGSTNLGSAQLSISTLDPETGIAKLVAGQTVPVPALGRADVIASYGSFHGNDGYIAAASNTGGLAVVPMANGIFGTAKVIPGTGTPVSASVAAVDQTTLFTSGFGVARKLYDITTGTSQAFTKPSTGGANATYFEYNEKKYFVSAEDINGSLKIFDITDGISNPPVVHSTGKVGEAGNAARTAPICVEVTENYAMIYVMATDNGIAAYKFVTEKPVKQVVETPTFSVAEGEYQVPVNVEIESATPNAIIHYTLDGTEPTEDSPVYSGAIELTKTTTVKAKAWLNGFDSSDIVEATYTITLVKEVVAIPTFSILGGEFQAPVSVEIQSTTPNAVIHYTLDGTEPTEDSSIYTQAIELTQTTTLKAKAWLEGFDPSAISEATYTIKTVLTPGITTEWKKTQAESGYLVTGQVQRAMAIYNGDLLIPNRNGHVSVISATDGSLKKTIAVTGVTGWLLSGITVTTDNVILLGSTNLGSTQLNISILDPETGIAKLVANQTVPVPAFGRADIIASYGSFYGNDGYVAAASNTGGLAVVPMTNGTFGTAKVIPGTGTPVSASVAAVDQTTLFTSGFGVARKLYDLTAETSQVFTKASTGGSNAAYFQYNGKKYFVSAEDVNGSLKIFDITNGIDNPPVVHSTGKLGETLST